MSEVAHSADVVIVGYGIAGAAAAVEASAAGADVLVVERTGGWGGAARRDAAEDVSRDAKRRR